MRKVAEKVKKDNTRKPKKERSVTAKTARSLKTAAVIVIVLLLIIIAAAQFGGVTFSTIGDSIAMSLAEIGAGDGYPYILNGTKISGAAVTNTDLAIVGDDFVRVLNSTAKELSNLQHTYDHPVMSSNSGRILLYDEGGKKFRVQSKTRILYERELEHIILTGAMGRDGSAALATRADGAESMLTVFDAGHNEAFVWKCAKEHIVTCDVSDNGRRYAAGVIGVKNGSVYSKIFIFDKKASEPLAVFEYPESAVTSVQFLSNETVMVMGNNMCEIINGAEVKEKLDVSVNTPSRLLISDNNTAVLVLSKYSSTTKKIVKVFDKTGTELFEQEIDGLVKSVSADGRYVAVLTDKQVQVFNMKGEMCGSAEVNADADRVLVSARNTYVYSSDRIDLYASVGDNREENQ